MSEQSRSLPSQTQGCRHGIDIDTCLFCAEFAQNQVWLSDAEDFFHTRFDCEVRTQSSSRGQYSKNSNWRRQIEFAKAEREGARPCPECRPYDPRRWRRKQPTSRHIGDLRLTHFTTLENFIGIVDEREIVARDRPAPLRRDISSATAVARRRQTDVPESELSVADCVSFSLTHRPGFMDALRERREDERLVAVNERPGIDDFVALETTFRSITHRRSDEASSFRLRWAVSSRDAADPETGFGRTTENLIKLIDFARSKTNDRFAEYPIGKNAEFLVEGGVPLRLISRVLVPSIALQNAISHLLRRSSLPTAPDVRVRSQWFGSDPRRSNGETSV